MIIGWRTLSDCCRHFPDYSKPDVVRLFSVTGGIPAVIKELDVFLRLVTVERLKD